VEWWVFLLGFVGLGFVVAAGLIVMVFLEAVFGNWSEEDYEDYDDSDDLDDLFRKKNYGD
jgi:hypothetical protein